MSRRDRARFCALPFGIECRGPSILAARLSKQFVVVEIGIKFVELAIVTTWALSSRCRLGTTRFAPWPAFAVAVGRPTLGRFFTFCTFIAFATCLAITRFTAMPAAAPPASPATPPRAPWPIFLTFAAAPSYFLLGIPSSLCGLDEFNFPAGLRAIALRALAPAAI
jgi:hypothetical protein